MGVKTLAKKAAFFADQFQSLLKATPKDQMLMIIFEKPEKVFTGEPGLRVLAAENSAALAFFTARNTG